MIEAEVLACMFLTMVLFRPCLRKGVFPSGETTEICAVDSFLICRDMIIVVVILLFILFTRFACCPDLDAQCRPSPTFDQDDVT